MKTISLNNNAVAMVDDEDFAALNKFRWILMKSPGHKDYVYRWSRDEFSKRIRVFMHREVLRHDLPHTDHVDGNGLNNQKSNLRPATCSQNLANRGKQADNISGFKGVHWKNRIAKWVSQIGFMGTTKHLGCFDDPVMAAKRYDLEATKLWGSFAMTNARLGLI